MSSRDINMRKFLNEGKRYVELNDPVQASEKLYKAAEEAIKVLSKNYAPDLHEEAVAKGRWTTTLLFKVVEKMSKEVDGEIQHRWNTAWTVHVQGFHEAKLDISYVATCVADIEELVKLAEMGA